MAVLAVLIAFVSDAKFLENRELTGKFRDFWADQLDLAWYLTVSSEG